MKRIKKALAVFISLAMIITPLTVTAQEPPTATVTPITADGLDTAYTCTPDESADEAAQSEYRDYTADLTVSFDRALPAGAARLAYNLNDSDASEWTYCDIGETAANEEISLFAKVIEANEQLEKITYFDVANSLREFSVGAAGIDAPCATATFKMTICTPEAQPDPEQPGGETEPAVPIVIASAEYTFAEDDTIPTATVSTVQAEGLIAAYEFTPNQTAQQVQYSKYRDCKADFEIMFDHDITEGELKLAYAYGDGAWTTFDNPLVLENQKISILDKLLGGTEGNNGFTYSDVVNRFKTFRVGATALDAAYDINMTIEFNIYEPTTGVPITVARQVFTFVDDGITDITLDVKNGEDIAATFTRTARIAKDNPDGRIYRITIPKGTYTSSTQLKLWSNTYVIMNGVTIKHTDTESVMLRFGNKSDLDSNPVTGYNGFQNIQIEGGTFDGNGIDQALIKIGHCKNISFKNVTFKNVKNSHMLEAGACYGLTVDNCSFSGFSGDWGATQNYEAVQFDVTDPKGEHFDGYKSNNDETTCNNITVKNCTFKNLQKGMGVHTGIVNRYCNNVYFENNTFENITGYAIIGTNFTNSRINSNTIKNCGSGIIFNTMVAGYKNFYASKKYSNSHSTYTGANVQIMNNVMTITTGYKVVYNNISYGIRLYGEKVNKATGNTPAGDFRCSGVTVKNNIVNLNATGYGIWLYGAVKNNVSYNTVNVNMAKKGKGGNGDGIRLQVSPSNTVSYNTINNSTTSGYDKEMSGITLCETSTSNNVCFNKINKPLRLTQNNI